MAPQLTEMNGLPARSDAPWMQRAMTSLPTPDSPRIRIGIDDAATIATSFPNFVELMQGLGARLTQ